ncbi:MAG: tetratricopeptide repeat protein [Chloroflexi bacterium]|nr:tetratricopeptide repeat protein [Chloroflexota bacterium]
MKRKCFVLLLLIIVFGMLAFPTIKNNLWSADFFRDFQKGSRSPGQFSDSPLSHPHARVLQARVAMMDQDFDLALQMIDTLVPSTDPAVLQTYAELLFSHERYREALDIWHDLGMYNKIEHAARVFSDMEMPDYEILAWEKAFELNPDIYRRSLTNSLLFRANQLRDSGEIVKAISLYQELITNFPEDTRAYAELASAYFQTDETELALENIDQGMSLQASDFQFYMQSGSIYEQCGLYSDAVSAYQLALEIRPDHIDAAEAIDRITNQ